MPLCRKLWLIQLLQHFAVPVLGHCCCCAPVGTLLAELIVVLVRPPWHIPERLVLAKLFRLLQCLGQLLVQCLRQEEHHKYADDE